MRSLPHGASHGEWKIYAKSVCLTPYRAVWQSKSDNGERVSATVAFGYKKADDDSKQWVIDEPAAKQELEKNKKRIAALDKLIEAAFEKNVLGTLRDDLFERMTSNYEQEQSELIQAVAELEQRLANAEQDNIDLRAFLSIIRKCTDLKELTPEHVNRLITKIEIFDSTKDENGKKHVPIKVHFIGVGILEIPDTQTIIAAKEEIRKNPPSAA